MNALFSKGVEELDIYFVKDLDIYLGYEISFYVCFFLDRVLLDFLRTTMDRIKTQR